LKTSRWFEPGVGGLPFFTADRDIDCDSGLVKTSRDTAGLATTYTYDALGRVTKETPGAGAASTSYIYSPETANSRAKVAILRKNAAGTVLSGGQMELDGFGRVTQETRDLPGGAQAERTSSYTAQGELFARTEWHAPNAATGTTIFGLIDPFGRPHRVFLPDGTQIEIGYDGVRRRTVDVPIATGFDLAGEPVLTTARTTELYDRFGRLAQIKEPNDTFTKYTYDELDTLTKVEMNTGGTPTQTRTFSYDDAGFLTSEHHPELGTDVI